MADDASYTAFLNKANQDPKSGARQDESQASTSQARSKFDPTVSSGSSDPSSAVPKALQEISATFVSDTDSDFEPVFFSYASTDLPSSSDFQKCLGAKGEKLHVTELSPQEFDPKGHYKDVIDKVKSAGHGEGSNGVKIFRVELDKTRAEYYIVTIGDRKLVGVVAKAVES